MILQELAACTTLMNKNGWMHTADDNGLLAGITTLKDDNNLLMDG
jgi:hypothetical protein